MIDFRQRADVVQYYKEYYVEYYKEYYKKDRLTCVLTSSADRC